MDELDEVEKSSKIAHGMKPKELDNG